VVCYVSHSDPKEEQMARGDATDADARSYPGQLKR
jgi:hypothetical protein